METNNEIWTNIPIKELNGKYEISNYGNLRSIDRILESSKLGTYRKCFRKGQYIAVFINKNGYIETCIDHKHYLLHRLTLISFIGIPDNCFKNVVNHKDGNKLNNHLDNLEWCTDKENGTHAVNNKLYHKFANQRSNKLNEKSVLEIRDLLSKNIKQEIIAKKYNVTQRTISTIKCNKIWKHI